MRFGGSLVKLSCYVTSFLSQWFLWFNTKRGSW